MREFFSFIFDKITDPLTLPIHPLWEWLILAVIGEIAYRVAYSKVGDMYRADIIRGKASGSFLHWFIRFLIFVPLWAVVYWTIVFAQWIRANLVVAIIILASVIVLAIAIVIIYKTIKKKQVKEV